MKIIVVFKTISGFTEKYARWISSGLNAKNKRLSDFSKNDITDDTLIIFGGRLHAVGINGYKELKRRMTGLNNSLIIFTVGASPKNPGIEEEIMRANFKTEKEMKIKLFYMRGGFDYSKLNIGNLL